MPKSRNNRKPSRVRQIQKQEIKNIRAKAIAKAKAESIGNQN